MYYSDMPLDNNHRSLRVHSCGAGRHDADWSWETDGTVRYAPNSLLLITEGICRIEIPGNKDLMAEPGDLVVLRWDKRRRESNASNSTLVAPWCSFVPDEQQLAPIETAELRRLPDPPFAYACMQRVIDAHLLGKSDQASTYLAPILAEFSRGLSKRRTEQDPWTQRIRQSCQRIQAQPELDWSISRLAAEHHCVPDHFARVFRRFVGETPGRYVIRCRIERARQLLLHSDQSIAAIAELLQYCDAYAFSRQFKQRTGQSPSAFRSSNQSGHGG